jgi:hypothetical protein
MRNMPVLMDTSNRARAPQQNQQARGNAAQVDQMPNWQRPQCKCFNCNKEGHFQAQCWAPWKEQINSVMDEPENMVNIQEALTLDGILDNALTMFDRLLDQLKDDFIQKYKGELQNFQDV